MKKLAFLISCLLIVISLISCKEKTYNLTIYYGTDKVDYTIKANETINELDLPKTYLVNDETMFINDYYYDSEYINKFDLLTRIKSDLTLYANLNYSFEYVKGSINKDSICNNLYQYIDDLIDNTNSYIPSWNKEGFKGRWNYIDGVFLNSIVNLYNETKNSKYKDFFLNYIDYYIDSNGNFINPETLLPSYNATELDSVCESKILFDAYEMTKDKRYLNAINYTYTKLNEMPIAKGSGNYCHKSIYNNQIWLDGMYMYVPFLARYANLTNNDYLFNSIMIQYDYIRKHMFDEDKKLYYHGHDTTKTIFWANKETGNSSNFWLRSNGWYIVSLVDVLDYYPEGDNRDVLIGLLNESIEGIMQYKDSQTNLFYQLVDKMNSVYYVDYNYLSSLKNTSYTSSSYIKNYLESSGSSMIAYAIIKGVKKGYLSDRYLKDGIQIFEGIYDYSFKNNSLNNICITAGLGPENKEYRDGSISYYLAEPVGSDDAKGVGPFLMAFIEYSKLNIN